jgi:hypothetical protein
MMAPEGQRAPFSSPDWIYEIQFDGYRCGTGDGMRDATP